MSSWVNLEVIRSVLDVGLVYLLIYKILLLVRGTQAEPMLKGLAMVVVAYVISRWLGLITLNWILGNFLGSVILVVVVLFQEEIRRGLLKVGLVPGFAGEDTHIMEGTISEISKAAAELAKRKIGALIAIRRDVGLEDYTAEAVAVESRVSHQLLISMFLPQSPLHDGAVVVEGNTIVAAGAVLPLSFAPTLSSEYGTRHRAALGLSERTDAVIVVVSEESGRISLVREGRISRDFNERSLYTSLYRLTVFRQQRRAGGWIKIILDRIRGTRPSTGTTTTMTAPLPELRSNEPSSETEV